GGQRRRVAIARAMASRPKLLLLDDSTTGLDPITAVDVNEEIVKLRDLEHITCIMVTHQIRDAFYVATHEAVRQNGDLKIIELDASHADNAEFMVLHELGGFRLRGVALDDLQLAVLSWVVHTTEIESPSNHVFLFALVNSNMT